MGNSTGWVVCFRAARALANRASRARVVGGFEIVRGRVVDVETGGCGGGGGGGGGKETLLIGRSES